MGGLLRGITALSKYLLGGAAGASLAITADDLNNGGGTQGVTSEIISSIQDSLESGEPTYEALHDENPSFIKQFMQDMISGVAGGTEGIATADPFNSVGCLDIGEKIPDLSNLFGGVTTGANLFAAPTVKPAPFVVTPAPLPAGR